MYLVHFQPSYVDQSLYILPIIVASSFRTFSPLHDHAISFRLSLFFAVSFFQILF